MFSRINLMSVTARRMDSQTTFPWHTQRLHAVRRSAKMFLIVN